MKTSLIAIAAAATLATLAAPARAADPVVSWGGERSYGHIEQQLCRTRFVPGHWQQRTRRVRVPGRWVWEDRQVTVPGRWEVHYEEVEIPGRWVERQERVWVRGRVREHTHGIESTIRVGHRSRVRVGIGLPHHSRTRGHWKVVTRREWIPPRHERRPVRRWVPATHRTERVRVWKPARWETRTERVWVPARTVIVCVELGEVAPERHVHRQRRRHRRRTTVRLGPVVYRAR